MRLLLLLLHTPELLLRPPAAAAPARGWGGWGCQPCVCVWGEGGGVAGERDANVSSWMGHHEGGKKGGTQEVGRQQGVREGAKVPMISQR